MNDKDILREYTELIKSNTAAQTRITTALEGALAHFKEEQRKYEDFNNRNRIVKYWRTFQNLLIPLILLLALMLGAFIFVEAGHPINIKSGNTQIESR